MLTKMLVAGALCNLTAITNEWHGSKGRTFCHPRWCSVGPSLHRMMQIIRDVRGCRLRTVLALDSEEYTLDPVPLPPIDEPKAQEAPMARTQSKLGPVSSMAQMEAMPESSSFASRRQWVS